MLSALSDGHGMQQPLKIEIHPTYENNLSDNELQHAPPLDRADALRLAYASTTGGNLIPSHARYTILAWASRNFALNLGWY
jgi:hypothetical protein